MVTASGLQSRRSRSRSSQVPCWSPSRSKAADCSDMSLQARPRGLRVSAQTQPLSTQVCLTGRVVSGPHWGLLLFQPFQAFSVKGEPNERDQPWSLLGGPLLYRPCKALCAPRNPVSADTGRAPYLPQCPHCPLHGATTIKPGATHTFWVKQQSKGQKTEPNALAH